MSKKIFSAILSLVLAILALSVPANALATTNGDSYSPRTTAPADNNKYYIVKSAGGLNECIPGTNQTTSALPNCVGYAWGRAYEITGVKPRLSKNNAKNWYGTNDGYARGGIPSPGSIMCWTDSGASAGHVAVVEEVRVNNGQIQIRYSQSFWGGAKFGYTEWVNAPQVGSTSTFRSNGTTFTRTFQGYIYVYKSAVQPQPPTIRTSVNGTSVTVSWNAVPNAASYDVYLIQAPWNWSDVKYSQSTTGTSITFHNVKPGGYAAFAIARPQDNNQVQSNWSDFRIALFVDFTQIPSPFPPWAIGN